MRSFSLLRLESNSTNCLAQIASGNYRLLPYSIEFWIEHCSQYASKRRGLGLDQLFQHHLAQMHKSHEDCLRALGHTTLQVPTLGKSNDSNTDERLELFSSMPIYRLMVDVLNLRRLASQLDGDNSSGMSGLKTPI
jgi:hypothetical protein